MFEFGIAAPAGNRRGIGQNDADGAGVDSPPPEGGLGDPLVVRVDPVIEAELEELFKDALDGDSGPGDSAEVWAY